MKVLFALRLYSGLESSIIQKKWEPNGIPTIYKLLEGMEKKHEVKVLLFHKTPSDMQYSNYKEKKDISVKFIQFKKDCSFEWYWFGTSSQSNAKKRRVHFRKNFANFRK